MTSIDLPTFEDAVEQHGVKLMDIKHTNGELRVAHSVTLNSGTQHVCEVGMAFIEAHRRYDDVGWLRGYAIDEKEEEALKYHCREEWLEDAVVVPATEEHSGELGEVTTAVLERVIETIDGPYDISEQLN